MWLFEVVVFLWSISVSFCSYTCMLIHSFFAIRFSIGLQLWRLWMCMRMHLYGECRKWKYFFLCVIFFSSFFIQLRLDYKAPKLQKLHLHVSESGRYRQASRYVRFHCTTTSVIQFPKLQWMLEKHRDEKTFGLFCWGKISLWKRTPTIDSTKW